MEKSQEWLKLAPAKAQKTVVFKLKRLRCPKNLTVPKKLKWGCWGFSGFSYLEKKQKGIVYHLVI